MSNANIFDQALAFAGILQALQLVQKTAYGKPCDAAALQCMLNSILTIDASSVTEIYGGKEGLNSGLRALKTQLMGGGEKPDPELSRYLITLLHLERKLNKRPDLLDGIGKGIKQAENQILHFDITHENVLANLADVYSRTVSQLRPQLMINGTPERLNDTAVANRIRALLLAAIRSAVLWQQCGGSRLGLLFGRNKLVKAAVDLNHYKGN